MKNIEKEPTTIKKALSEIYDNSFVEHLASGITTVSSYLY